MQLLIKIQIQIQIGDEMSMANYLKFKFSTFLDCSTVSIELCTTPYNSSVVFEILGVLPYPCNIKKVSCNTCLCLTSDLWSIPDCCQETNFSATCDSDDPSQHLTTHAIDFPSFVCTRVSGLSTFRRYHLSFEYATPVLGIFVVLP